MRPHRIPLPLPALVALFVLVTLAAVWLWAHEGHDALPVRGVTVRETLGLIVLTGEVKEALGLATAEARKGRVEERIKAIGRVAVPWGARARVPARLAGRLSAVHVQPGQGVRKGDVLALVQSPELDDVVLELRTALTQSRVVAELIRDLEEAGQRGAATGQQLLEARAEHQGHLITADLARRKLAALGVEENGDKGPSPSLPVRSPLDGVIVELDARAGQVVAVATPLFEIVNPSGLWLRLHLLERDLVRVRVGQTVEFSGGSTPVRSEVRLLGIALEEGSREAIAWADLENATVLPGLTGPAEVVVASRTATVVDPAALVTAGAERFVFVEQAPGQYQRQYVVIGRETIGGVEVLGGTVFPGDRVVTAGSHELAALLEQHTLKPTAEAARNVGLRYDRVGRHPVAEVVEVSGVVELPPDRLVRVASPLPGTVHRVHVDRAQAVKPGDLLAEVASPALLDLQLELLRNHAQAQMHEKTLAALRELPQSAASRRRLREAEATVQTTRMRGDTIRRKLQTVGLTAEQVEKLLAGDKLVEYLPIRAPKSGVVAEFRAVLGQSVEAEAPLLELHDPSGILVRGEVPQREAARVRVGQSVRVRFPGDGPRTAKVVRTGRSQGTGHAADSLTVPVWAALDERDKAPVLPEGMLARLAIVVSESEPVLALPASAVWREGLRAYVFVRDDEGTFTRRAVTTGRTDDVLVEITGGLEEGATVAVEGVPGLQAGFAGLK